MGNDVQTDLWVAKPSVEIDLNNDRVFILPHRKIGPPQLTAEVLEWLDQYAGDWGLENWYRPQVLYTGQGQEPGFECVGKRFQFKTTRLATLFKLSWA